LPISKKISYFCGKNTNMLSKITRKEIETKFGKEIRYPADCEALSSHILMETKQRVSTSTLKRILGFVKGIKEPRLYSASKKTPFFLKVYSNYTWKKSSNLA